MWLSREKISLCWIPKAVLRKDMRCRLKRHLLHSGAALFSKLKSRTLTLFPETEVLSSDCPNSLAEVPATAVEMQFLAGVLSATRF